MESRESSGTAPARGRACRLLIVSPIAVARVAEGWESLDLWVRDLEAQREVVGSLGLVAPQGSRAGTTARLPEDVRVVPVESLASAASLDALLADFDVVQLGAGYPLWRAGTALRFARAARRAGRCLILGVSSNRAATTILNARGAAWPLRVRARVQALGMGATQRVLAGLADGVFVTGHGLADPLKRSARDVHVGIASWIRREEVQGDAAFAARVKRLSGPRTGGLRLCVATRLEPMKGVHLAIEALRIRRAEAPEGSPELTILGEGPERERLEAQARTGGVADRVRFGGTFAYPDPFMQEIRRYDLMILPNLNVEQPRLIFDALSQGLVPICPDSAPYRGLELDPRVLFRTGDARSLADAIARVEDPAVLGDVLEALRPLAQRYTIEAMHEQRAAWLSGVLRAHERAA